MSVVLLAVLARELLDLTEERHLRFALDGHADHPHQLDRSPGR